MSIDLSEGAAVISTDPDLSGGPHKGPLSSTSSVGAAAAISAAAGAAAGTRTGAFTSCPYLLICDRL